MRLSPRHRQHLEQLRLIVAIALVALFVGSLFELPTIGRAAPVAVSSPAALPSMPTSPIPSPAVFRPVVSSAPPSPSPTPTVQPSNHNTIQPPAPFTWGITVRAFPFPEGNEPILAEQFVLAERLGVQAVRLDYSTTNEGSNEQIVSLADEHHLKLLFLIPYGPNDIFTDPELDVHTYQYVSKIVQRYKGRIPVWQLGNEVASVAIRQEGNYDGINQSDYPDDRYTAVTVWIKAAARAIHDNDPQAKILLTDDWVHTGFFDRFLAAGGASTFDILGWDWYSNEGEDLNHVVVSGHDGPFRLMTKLASYHKQLWLSEVSLNLGSWGDGQNGRQEEQAAFIEKMAAQAVENKAISGFFVYNLIQDQTLPDNFRAFSLLSVDVGKRAITGIKLAYWRYQAVIARSQRK